MEKRMGIIKEILWRPIWRFLSVAWVIASNLPQIISFVGYITHQDFSRYRDVLMESAVFSFLSVYWIPLLIIVYLAAISEGLFRRYAHAENSLRLEAYRDAVNGFVGIRVFNDGDDFTERTAELIGYSPLSNSGLLNMIFSHPHENRILDWFEEENKIDYRGHGLIKIVTVNEEGLRIHIKNGGFIIEHNTDEATWYFGVEIRGKINNKSIEPLRCCIRFQIRKDVLNDQRTWWAVVRPTLELKDCNWAKSMSAKEYLAELEKREKNKKK